MGDNPVVTAPAVEQKVVKVKVAKPPKEAKPPRLGKGWTEEKWKARLAELTVPAIPEGWLNMADVCKKFNDAGVKISRVVSASGGDRCANEPWDAVFQVKYVGGRKYQSPDVLVKGMALLNDPTFHPVVRIGRKKATNPDGTTKEPAPKGVKVKVEMDTNKSKVWVAPTSDKK
jgi:hypothetical protein